MKHIPLKNGFVSVVVASILAVLLLSSVTFLAKKGYESLDKEPSVLGAEDIRVTIDLNTPTIKSDFNVGVTHTQYTVGTGSSTAEVSGRELLKNGLTYANAHVHGWGVGPINETPGQPFNWSTLDARVNLMRMTGSTMVITFCCGPTWMVDPNWTSGTDWTKLEYGILPEHEQDYANLAKEVALRYPDVKYFQVWNEMKGLWNSSTNNWDYQRYTSLYNKIWDTVKAVRPDANIGGPYLKIEGSGGNTDLGLASHWYTNKPITSRNREVIEYWMANKRGADFITIDRNSIDGDENWSDYPEDKRIKLTHWFGDVIRQIKTYSGYKGEPIWMAEDYIWKNADTFQPTNEYQAAALASMLYHEMTGGGAVSLRWGPMKSSSLNKENLFTDTRVSGGGQALPAYAVYKYFHDYFGPNTQLFQATSSFPDVEVVSSASKTLLINKTPSPLNLLINNVVPVSLAAYEVKLMDTPTSAPTASPDTTAPTVSLVSPQEGAVVSGVVAVSAEASDNTGVVKVEFYVDGSLSNTDTAAPYSFSWDTSASTDGAHTLGARAHDSSNNSTAAIPVSVSTLNTVSDTTPTPTPVATITITNPTDGSVVKRSSSIKIDTTVSDYSTIAKTEFLVNAVIKCTDISYPYSCTWKVPGRKNEMYRLVVKLYDSAGNTVMSTPVTVTAK